MTRDIAERIQQARLFVQDCIDVGHDRGMIGNLLSARDELDAVIKDLERRRRAAPIEGNARLLLQLAERCEQESPSWELDARIEQAIAPDKIVLFDAGSVGPIKRDAVRGPLRDFPMEGWEGEWNWEAVAREVMSQRYTVSLDAASTLSDWVVAHASDIGADGLPYVVLTDGMHEAKGVAGRNLTLTWCAAALRARAQEAEGSAITEEQAERSEDTPECICPKCGIRHGGKTYDGQF